MNKPMSKLLKLAILFALGLACLMSVAIVLQQHQLIQIRQLLMDKGMPIQMDAK